MKKIPKPKTIKKEKVIQKREKQPRNNILRNSAIMIAVILFAVIGISLLSLRPMSQELPAPELPGPATAQLPPVLSPNCALTAVGALSSEAVNAISTIMTASNIILSASPEAAIFNVALGKAAGLVPALGEVLQAKECAGSPKECAVSKLIDVSAKLIPSPAGPLISAGIKSCTNAEKDLLNAVDKEVQTKIDLDKKEISNDYNGVINADEIELSSGGKLGNDGNVEQRTLKVTGLKGANVKSKDGKYTFTIGDAAKGAIVGDFVFSADKGATFVYDEKTGIAELSKGDIQISDKVYLNLEKAKFKLDEKKEVIFAEFDSSDKTLYEFAYQGNQFQIAAEKGSHVLFDPKNNKIEGKGIELVYSGQYANGDISLELDAQGNVIKATLLKKGSFYRVGEYSVIMPADNQVVIYFNGEEIAEENGISFSKDFSKISVKGSSELQRWIKVAGADVIKFDVNGNSGSLTEITNKEGMDTIAVSKGSITLLSSVISGMPSGKKFELSAGKYFDLTDKGISAWGTITGGIKKEEGQARTEIALINEIGFDKFKKLQIDIADAKGDVKKLAEIKNDLQKNYPGIFEKYYPEISNQIAVAAKQEAFSNDVAKIETLQKDGKLTPDEAIKQFGSLRKVYSEFNNEITLKIADAYTQTGKASDLAVAEGMRKGVYLLEAQKLEKELVSNPSDLNKRFDLATYYKQAEKSDEATAQYETIINDYDSIISSSKSTAEKDDAHRMKAAALESLGRFDEAISEYQQAAQSTNNDIAVNARSKLAFLKSKGTEQQRIEAIGDFAELENIYKNMKNPGLETMSHRMAMQLRYDMTILYSQKALKGDEEASNIAKNLVSQIKLNKQDIDDIIKTYSSNLDGIYSGNVPDDVKAQIEDYRQTLEIVSQNPQFAGITKKEFEKVKAAEINIQVLPFKEEYAKETVGKNQEEIKKVADEIFKKDNVLKSLWQDLQKLNQEKANAEKAGYKSLAETKKFQALAYQVEIAKRQYAITGSETYKPEILNGEIFDIQAQKSDLESKQQWWQIGPLRSAELKDVDNQLNKLKEDWRDTRVATDVKTGSIREMRYNPFSGQSENLYDTIAGDIIEQQEKWYNGAKVVRDTAVNLELVLIPGAAAGAAVRAGKLALAGTKIAAVEKILTGTGKLAKFEKFAGEVIVEGTAFHLSNEAGSVMLGTKKLSEVNVDPRDTILTFMIIKGGSIIEKPLANLIPALRTTVKGTVVNTMVLNPLVQSTALTLSSVPDIMIDTDIDSRTKSEMIADTMIENLKFMMTLNAVHLGPAVSAAKQAEINKPIINSISESKDKAGGIIRLSNSMLGKAESYKEGKIGGEMTSEVSKIIQENNKIVLEETSKIIENERLMNENSYKNNLLSKEEYEFKETEIKTQEANLGYKNAEFNAKLSSEYDGMTNKDIIASSPELKEAAKKLLDAKEAYVNKFDEVKWKNTLLRQQDYTEMQYSMGDLKENIKADRAEIAKIEESSEIISNKILELEQVKQAVSQTPVLERITKAVKETVGVYPLTENYRNSLRSLESGDFEKAAAGYEDILANAPESSREYENTKFYLARAYEQSGRTEEAGALYKEVKGAFSDAAKIKLQELEIPAEAVPAETAYAQAQELFDAENYEQAIPLYDQVRAEWRTNPERQQEFRSAIVDTADSYFELGNYEEAISYYQQFIDEHEGGIMPSSAQIKIAQSQAALGRYDEAINTLLDLRNIPIEERIILDETIDFELNEITVQKEAAEAGVAVPVTAVTPEIVSSEKTGLENILKTSNQKVIIEASHIYLNKQFSNEQKIGANLASELEKSLPSSAKVENMLFVDDYNVEQTTLDLPSYISTISKEGFAPQTIIRESEMIDQAKEIVKTLDEKGLIKERTLQDGTDVIEFIDKENNKLVRLTQEERNGEECKYSCSLLDTVAYTKKFEKADVAVTVLPKSYEEQQIKTKQILKALGYDPSRVVNIYFDEKADAAQAKEIFSKQVEAAAPTAAAPAEVAPGVEKDFNKIFDAQAMQAVKQADLQNIQARLDEAKIKSPSDVEFFQNLKDMNEKYYDSWYTGNYNPETGKIKLYRYVDAPQSLGSFLGLTSYAKDVVKNGLLPRGYTTYGTEEKLISELEKGTNNWDSRSVQALRDFNEGKDISQFINDYSAASGGGNPTDVALYWTTVESPENIEFAKGRQYRITIEIDPNKAFRAGEATGLELEWTTVGSISPDAITEIYDYKANKAAYSKPAAPAAEVAKQMEQLNQITLKERPPLILTEEGLMQEVPVQVVEANSLPNAAWTRLKGVETDAEFRQIYAESNGRELKTNELVAGFFDNQKNIIVINLERVKSESIQKGISYGTALRDIISHERTHQWFKSLGTRTGLEFVSDIKTNSKDWNSLVGEFYEAFPFYKQTFTDLREKLIREEVFTAELANYFVDLQLVSEFSAHRNAFVENPASFNSKQESFINKFSELIPPKMIEAGLDKPITSVKAQAKLISVMPVLDKSQVAMRFASERAAAPVVQAAPPLEERSFYKQIDYAVGLVEKAGWEDIYGGKNYEEKVANYLYSIYDRSVDEQGNLKTYTEITGSDQIMSLKDNEFSPRFKDYYEWDAKNSEKGMARFTSSWMEVQIGKIAPSALSRIYFNTQEGTAGIEAMRILAEEFKKRGIPVYIKTATQINDPRADKTVAYTNDKYAQEAVDVALKFANEHPELLKSGSNLAANKIARGVAFAQDPGIKDESFGGFISSAIAEGIAKAKSQGITDKNQIKNIISQTLEEKGINSEKPYLRPYKPGISNLFGLIKPSPEPALPLYKTSVVSAESRTFLEQASPEFIERNLRALGISESDITLAKDNPSQRIDILLKYNKDPNLLMGGLPAVTPAEVAKQIELLKDPENDYAAARFLGEVKYAGAVPALIELLKNSQTSYKKEAAADALGQIGDKTAISALAESLKDKDTNVIKAAKNALDLIVPVPSYKKFGSVMSEISPDAAGSKIIQEYFINEKQAANKKYGMYVYAERLNRNAKDIDLITDSEKRIAAIKTIISQVDSDYSKISRSIYIAEQIELLKSSDYIERGTAAERLSEEASDKAIYNVAIPALIELSKDSNENVRQSAVYALKSFSDDKRVISAAIESLKDPSPYVVDGAAEIIAKAKDASAIPALIDAFKGESWQTASFALDDFGKLAIKPLTEALKNPDPNIRKGAAYTLGEINDASAVPALSEALKDPEINVRNQIVESLGGIKDPAVLDPIIKILKTDPESSIRRTALASLALRGAIKDPRVVPALIEALKDPDINVGKAAASSLGDVGPDAKDAIPALIEKTKDSSSDMRKIAVVSLGKIGDKSTVPALIEKLKDGNIDVMTASADALVKIGVPAAPALIEALKSPDKSIRISAAEVLGTIYGPFSVGRIPIEISETGEITEMSLDPKAVLSALIEASRDPETDIRLAVTQSIDKIIPALGSSINDINPSEKGAKIIGEYLSGETGEINTNRIYLYVDRLSKSANEIDKITDSGKRWQEIKAVITLADKDYISFTEKAFSNEKVDDYALYTGVLRGLDAEEYKNDLNDIAKTLKISAEGKTTADLIKEIDSKVPNVDIKNQYIDSFDFTKRNVELKLPEDYNARLKGIINTVLSSEEIDLTDLKTRVFDINSKVDAFDKAYFAEQQVPQALISQAEKDPYFKENIKAFLYKKIEITADEINSIL